MGTPQKGRKGQPVNTACQAARHPKWAKTSTGSAACPAGIARELRVAIWVTLGALLLTGLVLWSLIFPGPASAYVNPTWFQEQSTVDQHAVTDFLYEQSAQGTVPFTGGEAQEISESVSHTYESQADDAPFYEELAGKTNLLEESAALDPPIEVEFPTIAAAGGAFLVGWEIGEGINAIFAEVGLDFGSAPEEHFLGVEGYEFCYSEACNSSLTWFPYGEFLFWEARVQQKPGAYLYAGTLIGHGKAQSFYPVRWFASPCGFSDFSPPPFSVLEEGVDGGAECSSGGELHHLYVDYPYTTVEQILSHQEFHHYDPLTDPTPARTSPAPTDPGTAVVEETAAESLDEDEMMQSYLTEAEEPEPSHEYFPAPTATEKKYDDEERRCDRGTAAFDNLSGNGSPGPFELKEPTAFTVTNLPEGVESTSPVYLRWGETSWLGEKVEGPQFMDLWGGWGYRHIRAKHGWNDLDREETELALKTPQVPVRGDKNNWIYSALDPGAGIGGVECERKVVVDFKIGTNPITKEEDPAPRGIVTSFNVVK